MKGWVKICNAITSEKKAGDAILITDNENFRERILSRINNFIPK